MLFPLLLRLPRRHLLMTQLNRRRLSERLDPLCRRGDLTHRRRNLTPSNQTQHKTYANDECQHEAVHAVPWRSPAPTARVVIGVVEEHEADELADEGVGRREE